MTSAPAPAKKATAPRKAARSRAAPAVNGTNGTTNGTHPAEAAPEPVVPYEPPADIRPPAEHPVDKPVDKPVEAPVEAHPIYGTKKIYSYAPKDGSAPIVLAHISNARPTPKFFYRNRNKDEMHQAFAWMDLCGIPDSIGERVFDLPQDEQATVMREWFGGLDVFPAQGVAPPGES